MIRLVLLWLAVAMGMTLAEASADTYVAPSPDSVGGPYATRPHHFYLGAGGNYFLDRLRWRHWGQPRTVARGRSMLNSCRPDCAAGMYVTDPVRLELFRVAYADGRRQYLCYRVTRLSGQRNKVTADQCRPGTPPAAGVLTAVLGDSYASGTGLTPYDADSVANGKTCFRSRQAFGPQLTLPQPPGVSLGPPGVTLVGPAFLACSGATIPDVVARAQPNGDGRPQLDGLTPLQWRTVGLVTMTVSGDDVGFVRIVKECSRVGGCPARTRHAVDRSVSGTGAPLTSMLRRVRSIAPQATVVLLGYPHLFPPRGAACPAVLAFSGKGRAFLNAQVDHLRDVQRAAARRAGVFFVDVIGPFAGHELCTRRSYINSTPFSPEVPVPWERLFHPNVTGQATYARAARGLLNARLRAATAINAFRLPHNPRPL